MDQWATFWQMMATAAGALILLLIGMMFKRMGRIDDKLDVLDVKFNNHLVYSERAQRDLITKADCKDCPPLLGIMERLENMHKAREFAWTKQDKVTDELWRELDGHSHEGLLQGSRVIRMPK